jgi:hypothetical protein
MAAALLRPIGAEGTPRKTSPAHESYPNLEAEE